jgi:Glycosyltransferase family 87
VRWDLVIVTGFYAAFATLLERTTGLFTPWGVVLAFGGWAVCVAALAWPCPRPAGRWLAVLLALATIHGLYRSARFSRLMYLADVEAWAVARIALLVALLLSMALAGLTFWPRRGRAPAVATHLVGAATVLALLVARAMVVPASPSPHIDVFTSATRAAEYLLEGRNPYAQAYVDIYAGAVGYPPGYPYPPGVLLPEALARWLLGDIRWALIAADAVTVLGLSRIAGRLGAAAAVRWWLPLLWLSFSAAPFSREQAWVDPLLMAAAVAVVALLLEQRVVAAGAALGYACSVKQYAIIAATLVVVAVVVACPPRSVWRLVAAGGVVMAAVIGPFLLVDPASFLHSTIRAQLAQATRTDALTLTAGLVRCCGVRLPGAVMLALGLGAVGLGAVYLHRARGRDWPAMLRACCAACTFAYGITFFFGKQAFLNYYELLLIFPVLYLALRSEADAGTGASQAPVPTMRA